jgi:hypothetical protein
MTLCFEIAEKPWPIRLEQRGSKNSFRVTYGFQVDDHLTYEQAAAKLGQAIMHRAACDGMLDAECAA